MQNNLKLYKKIRFSGQAN